MLVEYKHCTVDIDILSANDDEEIEFEVNGSDQHSELLDYYLHNDIGFYFKLTELKEKGWNA